MTAVVVATTFRSTPLTIALPVTFTVSATVLSHQQQLRYQNLVTKLTHSLPPHRPAQSRNYARLAADSTTQLFAV